MENVAKYGLYAFGKDEEYYVNDDYFRSVKCIYQSFNDANGNRLEYRSDWSSDWGCYCNS